MVQTTAIADDFLLRALSPCGGATGCHGSSRLEAFCDMTLSGEDFGPLVYMRNGQSREEGKK